MAESVARVKIQAIVDGLQGFDQFTSAIKKLQGAIGPADQQLEKARRNIVAFGEANKESAASIEAQINALKALKGQAGIGGEVFRLINRDINRLTVSMEEASKATRKVSGILTTAIPAKTPDGIQKQINGLKELAQQAEFMSDRYVAAVSRIRGLQQLSGNLTGRERVVAGAQAANDVQLQNFGNRYLSGIDLPDTNNALGQRIQEITQRLGDLTRGSAEWRQAANEQKRLTKELAEGFDFVSNGVSRAKRRLEEFRQTMATSGFAAWSKNPTAMTDAASAERAIQKSIERNRRKQGLLGADLYDAPIGPPPPSELFKGIGGIQGTAAANQAQLMGRSYQQVAFSIREATKASDGSVFSLQRQRQSWEQLRNTISPLDKEFDEIDRAARKAINTLDRQIGRRQVGSRGGSAQIGQGFGALAASGVFGGPEGFAGSAIGGGIGALMGGPAGFATGTFVGGSAGAYASMARKSIGGFSDYAAELEKQRIALEGVAGSVAEYERALRAASDVSARFNVPIGDATKGLTQLTASVVGAGGKVADAELVYKNVTAAIKATGGGAEEVQGSLLAMSQIFSKGKVQAEELRGQLGERLPGAVTMFAKATGRSTAQLSKDLELGAVGLNDVMKFVIALGQEYGQTADKIAQSGADAGQRLQTAFADFKATIGEGLVPLGAELQDSITNFLKEITPAAVELTKGIAEAIKFLLDNAGAIGNLVKFGLQMGAVTLAMKAFIALKPAIIATYASIQLGGMQAATAAALATPKVLALGAALKAIAVIGVITVGVNAVVNGVEQVRNLRQEMRLLQDYNPAQTFTGATRETVQGAVSQARQDLEKFRREQSELQGRRWQTLIPGSMLWGASPLDFQTRKKQLETRIERAQKTISELDPLKFPTELELQQDQLRRMQQELTTFAAPTDDGSGAADKAAREAEKAAREAERLAAEQQRLDEQLARNAIQLDEERFRNRMALLRQEFEYQQELAGRSKELWAGKFMGRGAESAGAVVNLIGKLQSYDSKLFERMQSVKLAEVGLKSSESLNRVTSQGLPAASGGATAPAGGGGGALSSQARALVTAAQTLGVNPLDLGAIIGFETAGTYRPNKRGGAGGNYEGLIQMGPNERRAYGANANQSFEEQVTGPVVRYFQDRFRGVGMSTQGADLLTLYRTVLGGNPKASLTGRDAFGTSPQSGVARMGPHRSETLRRFFGGDVANVPAVGGRMPTGVAAQIRRDASAEGQVDVSKEQLSQSQALLDFEKKRIEELKKFDFTEFNQNITRSLREETLALEKNFNAYKLKFQLEAQGMRPELVEAEMEKTRLYKEQAELLRPLQEAAEELQDTAVKEEIDQAIKAINDRYRDQIFLVEELARAQTAQGAALTAYLGDLRRQYDLLTDIEQVIIRVSQTIESEMSRAMSGAVTALVTGSGSVKQVLSDMFSSIGQSFVKMATDIIAKQMMMMVLNRVLGIFGGGGGLPFGGGGGGGALPTPDLGLLGGGSPLPLNFAAANGATFANGTAKFAKGGIVSRPTYFKFANGGTMQNGLMGEAGPEAIVPLKRGFDGRLGIAQVPAPQGGDARMRDLMGRSPAQQQPPVLNMKFETTQINGVEYVSRDQLELAMAQTRRKAASDGAKRGMSMTLDKLQQSPATRSKVGIR
jgi:tape measure domain-containing protein